MAWFANSDQTSDAHRHPTQVVRAEALRREVHAQMEVHVEGDQAAEGHRVAEHAQEEGVVQAEAEALAEVEAQKGDDSTVIASH